MKSLFSKPISKPRLSKRTYHLYVILIITISLVPSSSKSGIQIEHLDKIGHFGAYALLGFLSCMIYKKHHLIIALTLFGIGLGILLELLQSYIPSRTTSMADAIANTAGVISGIIVYRFYKRNK